MGYEPTTVVLIRAIISPSCNFFVDAEFITL